MNSRLLTRLCLVLLTLLGSPVLADPIVIGETSSIRSKILDEDRTLMISLPDEYQGSKDAFPVIYVLDARNRFPHTVANVRELGRMGHMPPMIVVGIVNTRRTRDLTPAWTHPEPDEQNARMIADGGGADSFLRFLGEELVPHIEKTYRTLPYRVLEGHSFGGLFALHAMARAPQLFSGIIAISPSVWWDEGLPVARMAEAFSARPELKAGLYTSLADEGDAMLVQFRNLEEVLDYRAPDGLHWKVDFFTDEDHGTVPMPSVHRGLMHLFKGWQAPRVILAEGLDAVDRHFADVSRNLGFPVKTPERVINLMGYTALGNDQKEDAIKLFRENVKRYPDSANVYDSLGEALEKSDELKEARDLYRKAWKLAGKADLAATPVYRQNLERVEGLLKKKK